MASPIDTRKFAREQAGRFIGRLAYQVNQTRKSSDAAAVHDLQASLRRFSRLLRVFDACFDGKETRKLRRRLKRMLEMAHGVGRLDVAVKALEKSPRENGIRGKLQNRRKEAARDLAGTLQRWMDRGSSLKWRAALDASLTRVGDVYGGITADEFARDLLPEMAKQFLALGKHAAAPKSEPETLEEFRILCRKFRHTLELFAPFCGTGSAVWLDKVRRTLVLLSGIRDWQIVGETVSPYKGGDALASWTKKRQRKQRDEFRNYWQSEFSDAQLLRAWIESLQAPATSVRKPAGRALVPATARIRKAR